MASKRPSRHLLTLFAVLLIVGLGAMLWMRRQRHRREEEAGRQQSQRVSQGPKIFVAPVQETPPIRDLSLPGEVRAFNQSTIYAKLAGYLRDIKVDKGDRVTSDQLLGTIESPETDREVVGAEADYIYKKAFYERQKTLLPKHFVSFNDVDLARDSAKMARATLLQLQALQTYEVVRAPYDGLITARYVDPGALLPAATGTTTSATPLVDISDLSRVRVAVYVGQDAAPFLTTQTEATITQDERPGLKVEGTITRFAGALDPQSRTMLAEVWLDNRRYDFQPGTFVHVTLHLKVPPLPTIPSEGLLLRNNAPTVALVRKNELAFVQVQTGLDDGVRVQIKTGLSAGEMVALNVPTDLGEGARVQPVPQPKKPSPK